MNDQAVVNQLKGLVIDGVDRAASGHPGGPMSAMDLAYILFTEFLKFDPDDPEWQGRDRFILSAGHMSMLQYAILRGIGWLSTEDLQNFRQWESKTPGHPENFMTPGVECTTGPLGQGAAMSLGFAVGAKHCAKTLNGELFDTKIWTMVSDGDLQEGVALAAASLAGHLGLGNLIWIYDANEVQLSGPTSKCISDQEEQVFGGFGWQVIRIDGHDHGAIRTAYEKAHAETSKPSLIVARTEIGRGCPTMAGSHKTHGSPLPAAELKGTKENLGLGGDLEPFHWSIEAASHFQRNFGARRDEAQ